MSQPENTTTTPDGTGPVDRPVRLQGGLTNEQLRAAWSRALPGVQPTDRDLTAFALGVECGASLRHRWNVVTWSSRTDRTFDTRQEALDYITMNDTEGDWYLRPESEIAA